MPSLVTSRRIKVNNAKEKIASWISRAFFRGSRSLKLFKKRRDYDSPKSDFKKPAFLERFDPTAIPPEIWRLVIQEATASSPDPLSSQHELSFLQCETSSSERLFQYKENIAEKRNISLVCRAWNSFAQEFLYESIWISRGSQAKSLAHTLLLELVRNEASSGRYIRYLHIETPIFGRCSPMDIRTILDYASRLVVYTDQRSVSDNIMAPLDPQCSPRTLFALLSQSSRSLKRLSWTNYDDAPFHLHISSLFSRPSCIEYLELTSFSPYFALENMSYPQIELPNLKSLKLALDDFSFHTIAAWGLPSLKSLNIVSCDFNYFGQGFASFFRSHGNKIRQLELGHSNSLVNESHAVPLLNAAADEDAPFLRSSGEGNMDQGRLPPIARWCPNLVDFICSADAEWHWQTPDWIPPHVLLPMHPNVELIGIRGIDARLTVGDPFSESDAFVLLEQLASLQRSAFPKLRYIRDLSPESHTLRTCRPRPEVTRFWTRLLEACAEQNIWVEDYHGVNFSSRTLKRLSAASF